MLGVAPVLVIMMPAGPLLARVPGAKVNPVTRNACDGVRETFMIEPVDSSLMMVASLKIGFAEFTFDVVVWPRMVMPLLMLRIDVHDAVPAGTITVSPS